MQLNVVLMLVFAIFITIFAVFNASVVTVNFLLTQVELSLAIVIIVSALIGALIIWFFDAFKKLKVNKQLKELKKKSVDFEKNLAQKEGYIKEIEEKLNLKEQLIKELKEKEAPIVKETEMTSAEENKTETGE